MLRRVLTELLACMQCCAVQCWLSAPGVMCRVHAWSDSAATWRVAPLYTAARHAVSSSYSLQVPGHVTVVEPDPGVRTIDRCWSMKRACRLAGRLAGWSWCITCRLLVRRPCIAAT